METDKTYSNEQRRSAVRKVEDLDRKYAKTDEGQGWRSNMRSYLRRKRSKFTCQRLLLNNFPIVKSLRGYLPLRDLPGDVISGLTVGVMHIPQGQLKVVVSVIFLSSAAEAREVSRVIRAPRWHADGRRFEPPWWQ
jgi:hypothetical protein